MLESPSPRRSVRSGRALRIRRFGAVLLVLCWAAFLSAGYAEGRACQWSSLSLLQEMQPYNTEKTTADAVLVCALSAVATTASACANEPIAGLLVGTFVGVALAVKRVLLRSHAPQSWSATTVDLSMASAWLGAAATLLVTISMVLARRSVLPWQLATKLLAPRPSQIAWTRVGARSYLTFAWVRKLLRHAAEAPLRFGALLPLWPSESVEAVVAVVAPLWAAQLHEGGQGRTDGRATVQLSPIFRALCGRSFLYSAACRLLGDVATLCQPLCLQYFLRSFTAQYEVRYDDTALRTSAVWGVLLVCAQLVAALANNHMYFLGERVALRCRAGLSTLLYRKALCLSLAARRQFSALEVANAMASDVPRIVELLPHAHLAWSSLLQILGVLSLLCFTLRFAVLCGFGVVLLLAPLAAAIVSATYGAEARLARRRDARTRLEAEVLRNMRGVKAAALEQTLAAHIAEARGRELRALRGARMLRALQAALWSACPTLLAAATFAAYVLLPPGMACGVPPPGYTECQLDPATTFTTLTLLHAGWVQSALHPA